MRNVDVILALQVEFVFLFQVLYLPTSCMIVLNRGKEEMCYI